MPLLIDEPKPVVKEISVKKVFSHLEKIEKEIASAARDWIETKFIGTNQYGQSKIEAYVDRSIRDVVDKAILSAVGFESYFSSSLKYNSPIINKVSEAAVKIANRLVDSYLYEEEKKIPKELSKDMIKEIDKVFNNSFKDACFKEARRRGELYASTRIEEIFNSMKLKDEED